jgi:hypothetical protein
LTLEEKISNYPDNENDHENDHENEEITTAPDRRFHL